MISKGGQVVTLPRIGFDEGSWNYLSFLLSLPPDSITCLSHICRLQVRAVLGPDVLMRTDVIQQLPVPPLLHSFLQFRDIRDPR